MKTVSLFLLGLSIFSMGVKASAPCPSDIFKPFVGQWLGKALFVPAQGEAQASVSKDDFAIVDCKSFRITVNYLDSTKKVIRIVDLKATADSTQEGLFSIDGKITEGKAVSKMTGNFRSLQEGSLVGSFMGAVGAKAAYLNELLNAHKLPSGEKQLIRTVQVFADRPGGAYVGTRVVQESLLP